MILKITFIGTFDFDVFPLVGLETIGIYIKIQSCLYLCRIGRTGRAGKKGTAVSFFVMEKNQRQARDLAELLKRTNQNIPPELLQAGGSFYSSSGGYQGKGGGRSW